MVGVRALKDNLQLQRDYYDIFFHQTQEAEEEAVHPVRKRFLVVCRMAMLWNQHDSAKSMFRAQYHEAIDAILAQLNRRFDEKSYAPLQHLEDVILNAANKVPYEISDDFKKTYDNEIDFDKVTTELRFLPGIISNVYQRLNV